MTTTSAWSPADPRSRAGTTDLITSLLGGWLMIGLYLDGWAHRNIPELETFFTPWHAVFYAGFLALAGWLCWQVVPHRGHPATAPAGYGLGAVGVALFAVAGVGDAVWHTIFGIEHDIAALLSPTHLVLLVGGLLMITTPIRSAQARLAGRGPGWGEFLPLSLATAELAALLCFFFQYVSYFLPEVSLRTTRADDVRVGISGVLIILALLLAPLRYVLARWQLPLGAVTLHVSVTAVGMAALTGFQRWPLIPITAAAALAGDLVVRVAARSGTRWADRAAWLTLPPLLLLSFLWYARRHGGVAWPPELWAGLVTMSALLGLGLSLCLPSLSIPGRIVAPGPPSPPVAGTVPVGRSKEEH